MSISQFLTNLEELNVHIDVLDDQLKIKAPEGTLTPALINDLNEKKQDIIGFFQKNVQKQGYIPIEPAVEKQYYELSSAQKRMYFLQQINLNSVVYNITHFDRMGDTDVGKLEDTVNRLIERHESLRTSFHMVENRPVQKIHRQVDFKIGHYSKIDEFVCSFDLSRAPLLRVGLIETGARQRLLGIDIHHIICDGASIDILLNEFASIYGSGRPLPPLRIQYKDYAEWQNSETQRDARKEQETYWLEKFSGEIPVLDLPTDYPRPSIQSLEGRVCSFKMPGETASALAGMALENGVTLYVMLLSILNILWAKLSGQEEIIVGTAIEGRKHADLDKIIGMFVNTLALKNHPAGDRTFMEFLGEVRKVSLDAFENQEYPFEELVDKLKLKRDIGRNPLFDIMFVLQNMHTGPVGRDEETEFDADRPVQHDSSEEFENKIRKVKFDLSLTAMEKHGNLHLLFSYCTKLFKEETIERFIIYFHRIVLTVLKEPGIRLSEIEIISEEEKNRILYEFNNTVTNDVINNNTIVHMIEEQVEKIPGNASVLFNDVIMTYRELNGKANALAAALLKKGVKKGKYIPLFVKQGFEYPIAVLAVLKTGAAFVPMDINWPPIWINEILKDLNSEIILTNSDMWDVNLTPEDVVEIVETSHSSLCSQVENHGISIHLQDPVYAIYTSGSTGKPKGAVNIHKGIANKTLYMNRIYNCGRDDVYLTTSNIAFDSSVAALSWSLCSDSILVLPSTGIRAGIDLENIIALIREKKVTIIGFVPSVFNILVDHIVTNPGIVEKLKTLRLILIGGEEINPKSIRKFKSYFPNIRIFNTYGPSETSISTIYFEILQATDAPIPVGKPINNIYALILDKSRKIVPVGVTGELYLGGSCVGSGYLNDMEKTAGVFLNAPCKDFDKGVFYKTGDMARWLYDGNIEFLGRSDHQLKIRGNRIELGEIVNRLLNYPLIKEAVVSAREDQSGEKYLCAYIVSETELGGAELKEYLTRHLPDYMIPSYFMHLGKIPLTPNGKIDRNALPGPEIKAKEVHIAPRNDLEEKLAEIWAEILGIEKDIISMDSNFFELGGQSLKATVMVARIHKELNRVIALAEIFKAPTIEGIASLIDIIDWAENKENRHIADVGQREEIEL